MSVINQLEQKPVFFFTQAAGKAVRFLFIFCLFV